MSAIRRIVRRLREDGVLRLSRDSVPIFYNQCIAPALPRTRAEYNGIAVGAGRLFDSVVPWRTLDRPNYESGLVAGIRDHVETGDDVVVVGGGWGVTAVIAALNAGGGHVAVYEGSKTWIDRVRDTVKMNGVADRVTVVHGVVGSAVNLRNEAQVGDPVSPAELPECDILELDCEGAELEILERMTVRPRVILVESHGMQGAPSSAVSERLQDLSYTVQSKVVADDGLRDTCVTDDIYTISAVKE